MTELALSIGEPMSSPAWGSNFVVFMPQSGVPVGELQSKEYMRRCCKYARHYGVWLVPERFILMGYQCMCLISPEGSVTGAQKGIFGGPNYKSAGKKSTSVELMPTEFGSVFLCVDVDIYRPEVARMAAATGAQIIIASQAIAQGDYSSHMVLTGAWNASQLAQVYVVATCNQFNAVCAPLELTPLFDGFLTPPGLKLPVVQKFQAERLAALERPRPLTRKLYALHRPELTA
ncbi:MAG: hypothetical protein LBU86_02315 [Oscillospiraceae bacterium]|nr:hypothetical protein [Oscillospiraceae bacterium]